MANEYEGRNDRFSAGYGRGSSQNDRDYGSRGRGYPDGDRFGSDRDGGRTRFSGDDRYSAGDRDRWTTDDLGYSDYGYSGQGGRRSYFGNGFEDRERGYARQTDFDRNGNDRSQRGFMDRAGDEVASWFGDDQAERRRQMDQHRGKGPKGYKRTDERILEDVNDRLTDAPSLDATNIDVSVDNGEVRLGGFVSNRQDKRRAEDIAEDVYGVSHVQNNLRVGTGDEPVSAANA